MQEMMLMVSGAFEPAVYLIKAATVTGSCADVVINITRTSTAEIKGLKNSHKQAHTGQFLTFRKLKYT